MGRAYCLVTFQMSRFNDILLILETITIDEEYCILPEIEFNTDEVSLLIHRTLMGDDDAFAKIVAAHYQMVFNIGYRYLNNMEEAEDLEARYLQRWAVVARHGTSSTEMSSMWL